MKVRTGFRICEMPKEAFRIFFVVVLAVLMLWPIVFVVMNSQSIVVHEVILQTSDKLYQTEWRADEIDSKVEKYMSECDLLDIISKEWRDTQAK